VTPVPPLVKSQPRRSGSPSEAFASGPGTKGNPNQPGMPKNEDASSDISSVSSSEFSSGGIPANGKPHILYPLTAGSDIQHRTLAVLICFFVFFGFLMPGLCIFLARNLQRDDLRGRYEKKGTEDPEAGEKAV
jgi:hypothetical protein